MKTESGEKLKKMISKYAKESSRLCKIFLLIDFYKGVTEQDLEFLEFSKNLKMGFEMIFCRADKIKIEHWMSRSLALSFQLRGFHHIINPICHITTSQ